MKKQESIKKAQVKKAVVKPVKKTTNSNLSLSIYDIRGAVKGEVSLPKEIFATEASPKLLATYVRVYLANQRQGNAQTKTRAEVKGSTRKIYKQKGTGRARHGSKRAPIFVGGGVTFGPKSKDYQLKMNKKQKRKALFNALTLKRKEQNAIGLTDESLKIEPKTKNVLNFLKKLNLSQKKVLFILPSTEKNNLMLAARNLPNSQLIDVKSINPYVVLKNEKVVFLKSAVEVLSKHFLEKLVVSETEL